MRGRWTSRPPRLVNVIAQLFWRDGELWSESPGCPSRAWRRPADLAEARLATDPAVDSLALADGRDLLTAAFCVVPFAHGPLPEPVFGEAVTSAARAAFRAFLGIDGEGDAFHVMRGEPDDFLVFARRLRRSRGDRPTGASRRSRGDRPTGASRRSRGDRPTGAVWQVGGFSVEATTLTVRFEDVWNLAPPELRATSYSVDVLRDGVSAVSQNILPGIAPDARLFIDLAVNGGFLFTFMPEEAAQ